MKRIIKWAVVPMLLLTLAISFRLSAQLQDLCRSTSLRFDTALTAEQVKSAREYGETTEAPYLTFWGESEAWVSANTRGTKARQIVFNGGADLAYPLRYHSGSAPAVLEPNTCAVSTGLAWALWGADRVVGMELKIDGEEYRVSGVFEENTCHLIRWAEDGFTAVEIRDIPAKSDSYRYAKELAAACGLPLADGILWGHGISAVTSILPWLPLIIAGVSIAWYLLKKASHLPALFWGFLALGFVLALPAVLEAIPGWLVPTRWSDLDFWSRLWRTMGDRFVDFLTLNPTTMDTWRKLLIIQLLVLSVANTALSVAMSETVKSCTGAMRPTR